jgi:uncharacterized PurR-regulated membrane protein YhhQ (DUF165 family)
MFKFNLRKPTAYDFAQALERAARAFVVAALAIYPATALIGDVTSNHINADLATKAIYAGSAAAVAFLWRFFLPDVGRSQPEKTAAVPVTDHPHGSDVATDA